MHILFHTIFPSPFQMMHTWKQSSSCDKNYLKACQLTGTGSDVITTSCRYMCPCDGDGCQVVLLDYRDKGRTGDICEVTYGIESREKYSNFNNSNVPFQGKLLAIDYNTLIMPLFSIDFHKKLLYTNANVSQNK